MSRRLNRGFTLIEMLVVMAILAMLIAIAAPSYFRHVDAAKETALKEDLLAVRDSIDKYYTDHAKYPQDLNELVESRYLRNYPLDPITDSTETWLLVPAADNAGIKDIKSGAEGTAKDGSHYADW